MKGILNPIYQDTEQYTFKHENGEQTLYLKSNTWGLYICDRCGGWTTGLYPKGAKPRATYNHNCNPLWFLNRKNRGVYRLKKVLG